jgi:mediator of RNA polymerase II transcription subunit 18, fungi type
MHEYILFSQVSVARHDQVLQILAGITASQPTEIFEQHLIYQQLKPSATTTSKKTQPGKQQQVAQAQQLTYHKLVRSVLNGEGQWLFRAETTPQPGVSDMISRQVTEHIVTNGELERFRQGNGWYK